MIMMIIQSIVICMVNLIDMYEQYNVDTIKTPTVYT